MMRELTIHRSEAWLAALLSGMFGGACGGGDDGPPDWQPPAALLECAPGELRLEGEIDGVPVSWAMTGITHFDFNDTNDLEGTGNFWVGPAAAPTVAERAIDIDYVGPLGPDIERSGWARIRPEDFGIASDPLGNCGDDDAVTTIEQSTDGLTMRFVLEDLRVGASCDAAPVPGGIAGCFTFPP